jgi:DNA-binding XRE family transcriptional regulator
MAKSNNLLKAMPVRMEAALMNFGKNLKTARSRRGLSARAVADKIGLDQRSVLDAEKGKPTTSIATYIALLWVYDMLNDIKNVADPLNDINGMRLEAARKRKPVKPELDNDF